jgi:hypothetical protein
MIAEADRRRTQDEAARGAVRGQEKNAPSSTGADPTPAGSARPPAATPPASAPAAPTPAATPPATEESRGLRFVREASGRIRAMTPREAEMAVKGGTTWMDEKEALAGMRDTAGKSALAQASASGNAPPMGVSYQEGLRQMLAEGGPSEDPMQRADRRRWLEGLIQKDQLEKLAEARIAAETEIEKRRADPAYAALEARLRLQEKRAPEQLRGEYEMRQYELAAETLAHRLKQVAQLRAAAEAAKTPEEKKRLIAEAERRERWAQDEANVILGRGIAQFRPDLLSALAGGGFLGAQPVAATAGGGT